LSQPRPRNQPAYVAPETDRIVPPRAGPHRLACSLTGVWRPATGLGPGSRASSAGSRVETQDGTWIGLGLQLKRFAPQSGGVIRYVPPVRFMALGRFVSQRPLLPRLRRRSPRSSMRTRNGSAAWSPTCLRLLAGCPTTASVLRPTRRGTTPLARRGSRLAPGQTRDAPGFCFSRQPGCRRAPLING
jgi:hypothetical protein